MSATMICRSLLCSALVLALTSVSGEAWSADAVPQAAVPTAITTATAEVPPAPDASAAAPVPAGDDTFLLTIFLKHDESKPLPKINDELRAQGFFKAFPPPGIEVVSWYVMMGIGQVVTLRVPANRLREVNRAIESTAWGGYRTEFYPTYDYKAAAAQMHATDGKTP
jgi:hypothetical protein